MGQTSKVSCTCVLLIPFNYGPKKIQESIRITLSKYKIISGNKCEQDVGILTRKRKWFIGCMNLKKPRPYEKRGVDKRG